MSGSDDIFSRLSPRQRTLAGLVLALSNLMVVLDLTIANVSVPHIAGNLGISPDQGTWIITSYAVAEAICVPLTGWLAQRFGVVKMFVYSMVGFGLFSLMCGLSVSLTMIVVCRIGQGLCGGPIMPMSQTLLMRIFPPDQRGRAMGLWAMTTLAGPAMGPIVGGYISDNWSWHWIFFINLPIAALCVFAALALLRPVETETAKVPIDKMGLFLLVFWIGCLQVMLDIGRDHDWFNDPLIVMLGVLAVIGFIAFIIWELTEEHPVVDLRVFRHIGFTSGVFTLALCFGAYFSGIVIIPQWLQTSMGYTATWAGIVTAFTAIAALSVAPVAARAMGKVDPRILISASVAWLGVMSLVRTQWTSGSDFWTLAAPQFIQGFAMPFFMIPLTTLTLGSVRPDETASAAGLQNFLRTMAIAIATSLVLTGWGDAQRVSRNELASVLQPGDTQASLANAGFSAEQ
ncbi:MAG: DHA2 family efflux MFS transporter permease subunit, partial [bacterium]|nr:DHA2 family efflux MFS transporter permease subunit [bacterium]